MVCKLFDSIGNAFPVSGASDQKTKNYLLTALSLHRVKDKAEAIDRVISATDLCTKFFKDRFLCACIVGSSLEKTSDPKDIDVLCFISDLKQPYDHRAFEKRAREESINLTVAPMDHGLQDIENPLPQFNLAVAPSPDDIQKMKAALTKLEGTQDTLTKEEKLLFHRHILTRLFGGKVLFFSGNKNYFSELVDIAVRLIAISYGKNPEDVRRDLRSKWHIRDENGFIQLELGDYEMKVIKEIGAAY